MTKKEKPTVAILTSPSFRSSRALAEGLHRMLSVINIQSHIFYEGVPNIYIPGNWKGRNFVRNTILTMKYKLNVFALKHYDIIVICHTIPNAFKKRFGLEELRRHLGGKPMLFYEVNYLNNSSYWLEKLHGMDSFGVERYDWHLCVSRVNEITLQPKQPCTVIGMDMDKKLFYPTQKKEFIALIDFERQGYENYRFDQLEVLSDLSLKTIILNSEYTFSEIAEIYRQCSIYFVAFPEAFGLPIAELQACGAYVFSPSKVWVKAHRIDSYCADSSAGTLSDNFVIYDSKADLTSKINRIKQNYNPWQVFDSFLKNHGHFYNGDNVALERILNQLYEKR